MPTSKGSLVHTTGNVKIELIVPKPHDAMHDRMGEKSGCEEALDGLSRRIYEDAELAELLREHGDSRCGYGTPLAWYYEELAHRIAPRGNLSFDFA